MYSGNDKFTNRILFFPWVFKTALAFPTALPIKMLIFSELGHLPRQADWKRNEISCCWRPPWFMVFPQIKAVCRSWRQVECFRCKFLNEKRLINSDPQALRKRCKIQWVWYQLVFVIDSCPICSPSGLPVTKYGINTFIQYRAREADSTFHSVTVAEVG